MIHQSRVIENARAMAAVFRDDGWSVLTDGTDMHLVVVDLSDAETSAEVVRDVLVEAGIAVSAVPVPHADETGLRVGTPALTTRGLDAAAVREVAEMISRVIGCPEVGRVEADARETVERLCELYPLYPSLDPADW